MPVRPGRGGGGGTGGGVIYVDALPDPAAAKPSATYGRISDSPVSLWRITPDAQGTIATFADARGRYKGAHAANPAAPTDVGDYYINTNLEHFRVANAGGTAWVNPTTAIADYFPADHLWLRGDGSDGGEGFYDSDQEALDYLDSTGVNFNVAHVFYNRTEGELRSITGFMHAALRWEGVSSGTGPVPGAPGRDGTNGTDGTDGDDSTVPGPRGFIGRPGTPGGEGTATPPTIIVNGIAYTAHGDVTVSSWRDYDMLQFIFYDSSNYFPALAIATSALKLANAASKQALLAFEQNTSMNVHSTDDSDNISITFHNSGPAVGADSTMTVIGWFTGTVTAGGGGGVTKATVDPFIAAYARVPASGSIPDALVPATLARDTEVATAITNLIGGADAAYDTLGELAGQLISGITLNGTTLTVTRVGGTSFTVALAGLMGGGLTQAQVEALIQAALTAATTGNTETGISVVHNADGTTDYVVTAGGGLSLATVLAAIMGGTGVTVDRSVDGQITINSDATTTSDGVLVQAGSTYDAATGTLTLARSLGSDVVIPGFGTAVQPTHTEQYLAGKATQDFDTTDFTGAMGVAYAAGSHIATMPASVVGNVFAAVARISTDLEPTYADVNAQGINQFSDFTKQVAEIAIAGDMYEVWVSDYAVFIAGDQVEFR